MLSHIKRVPPVIRTEAGAGRAEAAAAVIKGGVSEAAVAAVRSVIVINDGVSASGADNVSDVSMSDSI